MKTVISRLVTAVILIGVAALAVLAIKAAIPKQTVGQDYHVWALFRDGSRLATSSPVKIAGVRVGEVERLTVEGDYARVDLRLQNGLKIPVDSWITKRAESAFGDSFLEIVPNGDRPEVLKDGDQLVHVAEGGSTDSVLRGIARTIPKVDRALDVVHDAMLSGRTWVEGKMRGRTDDIARWLDEDHVSGPLARADEAMVRFEKGTTTAADAVADAGPRVRNGLDRADKAIANARKQIADAKKGLQDGLASAREGMDRVDEPIDNASQIVAAINEGSGEDWKGTLGRLTNTPDLADSIEDATDTVRGGAAGLNQFRSWLGMRFEENVISRVPRVYVTAEVNARRDKFFLVELSRDPLGGYPETALTENPGTGASTRTVVIQDKTRFTVMFGKRMGPLQLRAGVKDSTPGLGVDLVVRRKKLRLSADVFGGLDSEPHVKVAGAYAVFRSFYVVAGIDDAFTPPGTLNVRADNSPVPDYFKTVHYGRDYFVGADLHFDDADLATLLRVFGSLFLAGV